MIKVGVAGYGVIGQRLADGVALQKDMELVGVADVGPNLTVRALKEKGMPYNLYNALPENQKSFDGVGVPVSGTLEDLIQKVDVMLDATSAGIGAKNKKLYSKYNKKAIFQGGENNNVADVFFHGYANYEQGIGKQFLKLTSCNTTGLIRAVDCLDRAVGIEKVAITIIRRDADPGDYHRGLTNALQVDKAPSHQALDLMTIMPHVEATGILVHAPVTHGHIITVLATSKKEMTKEEVLNQFNQHPRIRVVRIADGFLGNASLFRYARDLGNPRGDMYEILVFEETIVNSGKDIMFAINIPQEAVVIPESMDAVRAVMEMQTQRLEAVGKTNEYLGMGKWIAEVTTKMHSLEDFDYCGKTVILRVDINSPIDPQTKRIVNENRINMSLPTIIHLLAHKAKVAIIAHQGDTLDYHNLISMQEHAEKLTEKLGVLVKYVDDVCGPTAQDAIKNLNLGEAVLLGNLRYLTEEVSTFENVVKLEAKEMLNTYLIRSLAPLADFYVNDAFAAAHRNAPSMVTFQEVLPTAAGKLLMTEIVIRLLAEETL